jgi:LPPG:FO 2-phospho-L-lactate transferase
VTGGWRPDARYVALSGGIGGAKLCVGLAQLLGDRLTVIVNTGDDFEHLGLHVSPDIDTVIYTLAGLANPDTGWGRRDETWTFMRALEGLGGPTWFKLGDGDLATHVERTRRLRAGETLTHITEHLARELDVAPRILPMCDQPLRTVLDTEQGTLAFQDYFVREQCRPAVTAIRFDGAGVARPTSQILGTLADPALAGIIVCPSNPWLSVDPMLAVPGLRTALRGPGVPIVAVSPIVAGQAIKGPTAKIMAELGLQPTLAAIAHHYAGLIDGLVIDSGDKAAVEGLLIPAHAAPAIMRTTEDKVVLARQCLDFLMQLTPSIAAARQQPRRAPS